MKKKTHGIKARGRQAALPLVATDDVVLDAAATERLLDAMARLLLSLLPPRKLGHE